MKTRRQAWSERQIFSWTGALFPIGREMKWSGRARSIQRLLVGKMRWIPEILCLVLWGWFYVCAIQSFSSISVVTECTILRAERLSFLVSNSGSTGLLVETNKDTHVYWERKYPRPKYPLVLIVELFNCYYGIFEGEIARVDFASHPVENRFTRRDSELDGSLLRRSALPFYLSNYSPQFCPIVTSTPVPLWTGFFFVSVSSEESTDRDSHISPFDAFAPFTDGPCFFFFFSPFPSSILSHSPGRSWGSDRLFASLEARVRQFATPRYKNSHLRTGRKGRTGESYQRLRMHICTLLRPRLIRIPRQFANYFNLCHWYAVCTDTWTEVLRTLARV